MLALRDGGRLRLRSRAYLTAERLDEWIDRARAHRRRRRRDAHRRREVLRRRRAGLDDGVDARAVRGLGRHRAPAAAAGRARSAWCGAAWSTGWRRRSTQSATARTERCWTSSSGRARLAPELPRRIEHAQFLTDAGHPALRGARRDARRCSRSMRRRTWRRSTAHGARAAAARTPSRRCWRAGANARVRLGHTGRDDGPARGGTRRRHAPERRGEPAGRLVPGPAHLARRRRCGRTRAARRSPPVTPMTRRDHGRASCGLRRAVARSVRAR